MKSVNPDRPISPQNLFKLLLNSDFKESQCEGERSRITKQKQILAQLIQEYQVQIQFKKQKYYELEKAIEVRARLRLELETLMGERRVIDKNAADEIYGLRKSPIEIRNTAQCLEELQELRDQNCKMNIRLEEMLDYSEQLQRKIELAQKQNQIIGNQIGRVKPIPGLQVDKFGDLSWRQKIRIAKLQEKDWQNSRKYDIKSKGYSQRVMGKPLTNFVSRFNELPTSLFYR